MQPSISPAQKYQNIYCTRRPAEYFTRKNINKKGKISIIKIRTRKGSDI
jgi:hypothetical protein